MKEVDDRVSPGLLGTVDVGVDGQESQFHHLLPFENVYSVLIPCQCLCFCRPIATVLVLSIEIYIVVSWVASMTGELQKR